MQRVGNLGKLATLFILPHTTFVFLLISPTFATKLKRQTQLSVYKTHLKMSVTAEKKSTIFAQFGGKASNTGSIEGQVALLTERILDISNHLKVNKKDFSSQRGLMRMVGQRKRLLTYLSKHNLTGYRQLIEKLGLRK